MYWKIWYLQNYCPYGIIFQYAPLELYWKIYLCRSLLITSFDIMLVASEYQKIPTEQWIWTLLKAILLLQLCDLFNNGLPVLTWFNLINLTLLQDLLKIPGFENPHLRMRKVIGFLKRKNLNVYQTTILWEAVLGKNGWFLTIWMCIKQLFFGSKPG